MEEYNSSKYVGVLVTLDIISFLIIILLAFSANRAYKFMANKDRLLLLHFVFLEASLLCKIYLSKLFIKGKTLSLLFGAIYFSNQNM